MTTSFTANYGFDKPADGDAGWGTLRNNNMDDLDAELGKPRILSAQLTWGATTTLDLSTSRMFFGTNTQITTLAFTNIPLSFPNGANIPFVMWRVLITNGAAFAITYPGAVTWLRGIAPTLQVSGVDELIFYTRDGGTTIYGLHVGKNTAMTGALKSQAGSSATIARSPIVVHLNSNLSTGSTSEISLGSYSVPAAMLATNSDALRVRVHGRALTQIGQFRIKFGATYVFNAGGTNNISIGAFTVEVIIRRKDATNQFGGAVLVSGAAAAAESSLPAETLASGVTLDFRGFTTVGGGSLLLDGITVESIAA